MLSIRTGRVRFIAVVGIIVSLLCDRLFAGEAMLKDMGLSFIATFDNSLSDVSPQDAFIESRGGQTIADGVSGGALRLNDGEYLILDSKKVFGSPTEGTLMFWVRPHWSYYESKDNKLQSHTFFSFLWDDPRNAYFVLSDGWWAPLGSYYTYFVFNNQDYLHSLYQLKYHKNEWTAVACSWKTGPEGSMMLYVDGELAVSKQDVLIPFHEPGGNLYIGSDAGIGVEQSLFAQSDFDEIMFFSRSLSRDELQEISKLKDNSWSSRKSAWLSAGLETSYEPLKDQSGDIFETRAIFDEGVGWITESGARETIESIKNAGFNVYVPCVWHGAGTRYRSDLAASEEGLVFSEEDPLARLIRIAHAQGVEVHPWFTVSLRARDFLPGFWGEGTPPDSFDLHNREFRQFIVNLILDVVARYDIDGVNLDYIRTNGICASESCQKDYKDAFGRDLLVDISQRNPDGSLEAHVQQWQDQAVEEIVREVSTKGKAIKKGLIISVDGYPIPTTLPFPPNDQGRQEVRWAKAGYVDVIFTMDYSQRPDYESLALVKGELPSRVVNHLILGNYDQESNGQIVSRDAKLLADLISYTQRKLPGGLAVYLYSQLNESQVTALKNGPFEKKSQPMWDAFSSAGKVRNFRRATK